MRILNYIGLFIGIFFLFSCAEDKGNYDYKTLNEIEIDGFKPATEDNGVYTLLIGQHLKINPIIKCSLEENSELAYLWTLDQDTIGKVQELDWIVPDGTAFGEKAGRLIVTDLHTKINYYHNFTVVITNPFNQGYYIYSRDPEDNAIISFLSSKTEKPEFVNTDNIGGINLGKYPTFATCEYGYDNNSNETWHMYFAAREGEYSLIQTNTLTFSPTATLTADSYIGGNPDNYTFAPTYFYTGASKFFTSNGQLIGYNEGLLYRPAHLGDHKLAPWLSAPAALQNMALVVFDETTHRFLYLQSQEDDPLNGIIGDSYTYDKIIDFEGQELTGAEEEIVAGGPDGWDPIMKVITRDNNGLHFYTLTFDMSGADPQYKPVMTRDTYISIAGVNANTRAIMNGKTWYILIGNTIYKSPILIPELTKVKDIPEELGEVRAFNICDNGDKIIVATYQPDSQNEMKGSVYFLNSETGEILEPGYPNVTGEAVSILNTDYEGF